MLVAEGRSGALWIWTGSTLAQTWTWVAGVAVWAALITEVDRHGYPMVEMTSLPFSLTGVALSIFLGFRNNACYDRWWEARKAWGALVNLSRTVGREALTLIAPPRPEDARAVSELQRSLVLHQIAFCYALKHHLRDGHTLDELEGLLTAHELREVDREDNIPAAVVARMGHAVSTAHSRGWVGEMNAQLLHMRLGGLTDVLGICERIKKTPVPQSFTSLTHRITWAYCVFLPFGIVDQTGLWTPFVVAFVSYAFFGLDYVGTQLEDPFERDPNDLPLAAMCVTIERDLRQRIGDDVLPEPAAPVMGILL